MKINTKCLELFLWLIFNVTFATVASRNNIFSNACEGGRQIVGYGDVRCKEQAVAELL